MTPRSYADWHAHMQSAGPRMSDAEMEASARLASVLLCGEQSAIQIFSAEVRRGNAPAVALKALHEIELDEQLHEQALQALCEHLPRPDDLHALKRRAQRFFLGLGRIDDMARHFGQISHLDSAVCKIMWHVENCAIERASPLRRIATQIKIDEARHVSVSRRYAASLGLSKTGQQDDGDAITEQLIDMLGVLVDSFETIGVDSDKLFAHLRKTQTL